MNKNKILYFFIIITLFNLAASFVHPVTPTLIVERQLDSSVFGTALAAMQITMFLFSPFWGKLCHYIPTKKIMCICSIGYAIGQVIFGLAYNETMVFLGRMFAGIFTGGCFTAFSNYIVNTSTRLSRNTNLTTTLTIQTVGGALGYFVGGFLGLISVETSFIAQVITLLLCAVLFMALCVDDTSYKVKPSMPLTLKDINPFYAFMNVKQFMTPMLLLIFVIIAISGIGYNSYEQSFNYFIKDQLLLNSAYNGMIKVIIAALTMLFNATLCLYLQKRTDINKTFLPIIIILTAFCAGAIFIQMPIPFIGIYIVYNGFNAIRIPLLQSLTASHSTSENSNSVMGFYQSMNSLGSIFGALFAGIIYSMNPLYPFILAFIAYALTCVIGLVYVKKYNKQMS